MKILTIGGSGFVSGTLARMALEGGHEVWAVSRGQRPMPAGVKSIEVDRKNKSAFANAIAQTGEHWDLVVDCIGFEADDARQDIEVFRNKTPHLVFISTDFVYDPLRRDFPQTEANAHYLGESYGGKKRECELQFIEGDCGNMAWTIVRPCHIYGPGSLLGCLPAHGRNAQLIEKMQAGETLQLVGGGHFLQQPITAADLARVILSCANNPKTHNRIYGTAGPDIIESRQYYEIIAAVLGVELKIEEVAVDKYLAHNPDKAPFLCHRIYDLKKSREHGVHIPATPIAEGLREHITHLLNS